MWEPAAFRNRDGRGRRCSSPLILGTDWKAMFRNSARNLEERTELFNAVLER